MKTETSANLSQDMFYRTASAHYLSLFIANTSEIDFKIPLLAGEGLFLLNRRLQVISNPIHTEYSDCSQDMNGYPSQ